MQSSRPSNISYLSSTRCNSISSADSTPESNEIDLNNIPYNAKGYPTLSRLTLSPEYRQRLLYIKKNTSSQQNSYISHPEKSARLESPMSIARLIPQENQEWEMLKVNIITFNKKLNNALDKLNEMQKKAKQQLASSTAVEKIELHEKFPAKADIDEKNKDEIIATLRELTNYSSLPNPQKKKIPNSQDQELVIQFYKLCREAKISIPAHISELPNCLNDEEKKQYTSANSDLEGTPTNITNYTFVNTKLEHEDSDEAAIVPVANKNIKKRKEIETISELKINPNSSASSTNSSTNSSSSQAAFFSNKKRRSIFSSENLIAAIDAGDVEKVQQIVGGSGHWAFQQISGNKLGDSFFMYALRLHKNTEGVIAALLPAFSISVEVINQALMMPNIAGDTALQVALNNENAGALKNGIMGAVLVAGKKAEPYVKLVDKAIENEKSKNSIISHRM